jgi:hypothetical protein
VRFRRFADAALRTDEARPDPAERRPSGAREFRRDRGRQRDRPLARFRPRVVVLELASGSQRSCRVTLRAGTRYAALDRLGADGWVDVDREEIVDGRLRRYYRLTEPGAARLAAEVEKLRAHTRVARQRLRTRLAGGTA